MSDIADYLTFLAKAIKEMRRAGPGFKFASYEELILHYGQDMYLGDHNIEERGELGNCFANSLLFLLGSVDGEKLYYCEGYAVHDHLAIPLSHAWVITESGDVIDPTWDYPTVQYYGVALKESFVREMALKVGYHGVFGNDWVNDNELLRHGIPVEAIPTPFRKEEDAA